MAQKQRHKQPWKSRPKNKRRVGPSHSPRPNELWLYGTHAVLAALANPKRQINRLIATEDAASRIEQSLFESQHRTVVETASRQDLDTLVGAEAVHQGVAAQVAPLPDTDITDIAADIGPDRAALIVALDHVTDPHNVGAILRSAAAFGAAALLTTRHHAPEETGALAKAASGALETVPVARAVNLKRTFEQLQEAGFWSVGLDATADQSIGDLDLPHRCILVLGAEGDGLRQSVREACDFLARLPMTGAMESLNVSNAGAIALYEWQRQRLAR